MRTARTSKRGLNSQNMTARTAKPGQDNHDSQDRTVWKTARIGSTRTGQPELEYQDKIKWSEHDSKNMTEELETRLLGQDNSRGQSGQCSLERKERTRTDRT